ncbi:MAG: hypothetical protein IID32_06665, partial [Planctomycetes bacterium]|nr:hypothetical protein [Planctomycetota bacterium]
MIGLADQERIGQCSRSSPIRAWYGIIDTGAKITTIRDAVAITVNRIIESRANVTIIRDPIAIRVKRIIESRTKITIIRNTVAIRVNRIIESRAYVTTIRYTVPVGIGQQRHFPRQTGVIDAIDTHPPNILRPVNGF